MFAASLPPKARWSRDHVKMCVLFDMPHKPKSPLPASVAAVLPQRLHDAADAFYFAAILSTTRFHPRDEVSNQCSAVDRVYSSNRKNQDSAPSLVNFAFSIELYIKLLRFLADGCLMKSHDVHALFLRLEKVAPAASTAAIRHHRYARGNRAGFIDDLHSTKSIFMDWRYTDEEEFPITGPDNVHALADALRAAITELHPHRHASFETAA